MALVISPLSSCEEYAKLYDLCQPHACLIDEYNTFATMPMPEFKLMRENSSARYDEVLMKIDCDRIVFKGIYERMAEPILNQTVMVHVAASAHGCPQKDALKHWVSATVVSKSRSDRIGSGFSDDETSWDPSTPTVLPMYSLKLQDGNMVRECWYNDNTLTTIQATLHPHSRYATFRPPSVSRTKKFTNRAH
jgi:hypothetical protein